MWSSIFDVTNMIALAAWLMLILLPRKPVILALILYCGVGLLCAVYAAGLLSILTGLVDTGGSDTATDFTTIEGVRSIFATNAGVTIGWTHYLAFDLFAGLWIARDADAKEFSRFIQAPVLMATFLAGPLGLLMWLIVRDRRARRLAAERGQR